MNLQQISKRTERVIGDNSPAILTAVGVSGSLTTAYLSGKASFKAAEIIQKEQFKINIGRDPLPLSTREKTVFVWKLYIPAATTATVTVLAIVGANRIGTRRAAALGAAYSISERAFTEYKNKVVEKIGDVKERAIHDEILQDRINRNPPVDREVIITGNGDVLCHDAFSGRYFQSSVESLKKAQNDINYQILHYDYATVTDFYNKVGLEPTSVSDEIGWNNDKLLELSFAGTLTSDNKPCMSFDFAVVPIRDPERFH